MCTAWQVIWDDRVLTQQCGAQAAKARLLHTEPAAGAVGLAMMLRRLQQQPGHVALHLRHINPHVSSIFQVALFLGCDAALSCLHSFVWACCRPELVSEGICHKITCACANIHCT